ncbi:hypothetical protein TNCV_3269071 [Trichonephila clavipes]|nr:hypothetical protein TNCV_3269071 [Trichonephila clavipes]
MDAKSLGVPNHPVGEGQRCEERATSSVKLGRRTVDSTSTTTHNKFCKRYPVPSSTFPFSTDDIGSFVSINVLNGDSKSFVGC